MKSFQLNPIRVKYSKGEQRAFSTLRLEPRDSNVITKLYYGKMNEAVPDCGRVIVLGALKALQRKVDRNNEPFKIKRSKQNGPYPMEFWLEAK